MTIHGYDQNGVDISSVGTLAKAEPIGKAAITTVVSNADGSATYSLQVSLNGDDWEEYHDYGSVSSIQDTREIAARYVRLEITSTSLTGGSTADIFFAAGD